MTDIIHRPAVSAPGTDFFCILIFFFTAYAFPHNYFILLFLTLVCFASYLILAYTDNYIVSSLAIQQKKSSETTIGDVEKWHFSTSPMVTRWSLTTLYDSVPRYPVSVRILG